MRLLAVFNTTLRHRIWGWEAPCLAQTRVPRVRVLSKIRMLICCLHKYLQMPGRTQRRCPWEIQMARVAGTPQQHSLLGRAKRTSRHAGWHV